MKLKQFVPSAVCLKCDGCCRYKEADSLWRPKLGQEDQKGLADLINAADVLDEGYIKAIQRCGQHFCRFFNGADNTCGIYSRRPFECELYPFVLSANTGAIEVYAHLSCPYIQDHLTGAEFQAYVSYLKGFFHRADINSFLARNKAMFHDYRPFAPELFYLFDLPSL